MSARLRIMKEEYACEPEHWARCWEVPYARALWSNAPPLWDELTDDYKDVIQRMEAKDEWLARVWWNSLNTYRKQEWFKQPIAFTWKPDGAQITGVP